MCLCLCKSGACSECMYASVCFFFLKKNKNFEQRQRRHLSQLSLRMEGKIDSYPRLNDFILICSALNEIRDYYE